MILQNIYALNDICVCNVYSASLLKKRRKKAYILQEKEKKVIIKLEFKDV